MKVWAIADLHLSFGVPGKGMERFGPHWASHPEKIEKKWREKIAAGDLVLIPGDISWAMRTQEAAPDLAWIGSLPGTKLLLKGNHDYWWSSLAKIAPILPPSCHLIQNNAYHEGPIGVGGARLGDTDEFSFKEWIDWKGPAKELEEEHVNQALLARELERLHLSLQKIPSSCPIKIAMTHYPPIGPDKGPSKASALLEQYGITHVVFGHLHNLKKTFPPFGTVRGIHYHLTAADYLDFTPLCIV